MCSSAAGLNAIAIGDNIYLHGSDGNVYRGRSDPTPPSFVAEHPITSNLLVSAITPSPPSTADSSSRLMPRLFHSSSASSFKSIRPQSADPSRFRNDIDQHSGRKSPTKYQEGEMKLTGPQINGQKSLTALLKGGNAKTMSRNSSSATINGISRSRRGSTSKKKKTVIPQATMMPAEQEV